MSAYMGNYNGRDWYYTNCTEFNGNPNPRADVWWSPAPGGTYYWSDAHGIHYVGSGVGSAYARQGYQCGLLGAPTSEQSGAYQWFEGGYIHWANGTWNIWANGFGPI